MRSHRILIFTCAIGVSLASCTRSGCMNELAENYSEKAKKDDGSCRFPVADFHTYYEEQRDASTQVFSVDIAQGATIVGEDGTVLIIPTEAFGTSGNVEISLIEALTQADMIKLGLNTKSGSDALISAGELYFNATHSGTGEQATLTKSIQVYIPVTDEADPEMMVFDGEVNSDGIMAWTLDQSRTVIPTDSVPNFPEEPFYELNIDDLDFQWLNLDKYRQDPNAHDLKLDLDEAHSLSNTQAFVFFHQEKSVDQMTWVQGDENYFLVTLPNEADVSLVLISKLDDAFYSTFQRLTMTSDESLSLQLDETTQEAFEEAVDQL